MSKCAKHKARMREQCCIHYLQLMFVLVAWLIYLGISASSVLHLLLLRSTSSGQDSSLSVR